MSASTLTSKGQTTIPKDIRRHLRLKPGDRMEFIIEADGQVTMLPASVDAAALKGILPKPKRPVSLEDMERAIRKRVSGR